MLQHLLQRDPLFVSILEKQRQERRKKMLNKPAKKTAKQGKAIKRQLSTSEDEVEQFWKDLGYQEGDAAAAAPGAAAAAVPAAPAVKEEAPETPRLEALDRPLKALKSSLINLIKTT
jgi:hypothetical protein